MHTSDSGVSLCVSESLLHFIANAASIHNQWDTTCWAINAHRTHTHTHTHTPRFPCTATLRVTSSYRLTHKWLALSTVLLKIAVLYLDWLPKREREREREREGCNLHISEEFKGRWMDEICG